ncbi:MAG: metalloregulator ArsR/SmtB family transcription factor [Candidatus Cloacimonetes bacterium]|nr:metalloregulator ArsR/SmtB family transcription factor [Candidatus Cloacimonadota bacterium]
MGKCDCDNECCCQSEKQDLGREAAIFKALGHPSRLLMLTSLADGKKCVCELQQLLGVDMSTVSKHLNVLKKIGIVDFEKEGNYIYYRLLMPCVIDFLNCIQKEGGCQCSNG